MKLFLRSFALAIGLFFFTTLYLSAQVDRTFWFVAPDASLSHSNEDQYIKLRLTNVSAVAATVTISMPKNSTFATQTIVINPGVQSTVTLNKADVENGTDGNRTTDLPVMNKGLLIESTQDITAYYEVGTTNNPDKFTLKGNSALGTEFYVPSNLDYRNYPLTIKAKEKIDIVATEDTKVTIIPTTDCVGGRKAGESFDIDLKRGETYCLEAVGEDAKINLGGTHIVSTGKIAVTISDDSINLEPQGNYDIIGDQLIPVDVIGDKYVAIKTNDSSSGNIQKVYLTAVRDNSVIWYGTEKITLNKGQSVSRDIAKDNVYIYSEIGVPFYAYQVTGYGYEMGSAILPPITCTGSKQVDFNRSFVKDFWIQILAKDTDIGSFKLMDISQNKDKSSLLPAQSDWDIVYDKNGMDTKWRTVAVKSEGYDPNKPYTGISTGTTYRISNSTGKFHFSVLDQNGASLNYGYFSAYNSIRVDGPTHACVGENNIISTSAVAADYNITWHQGNVLNPEIPNSANQSSITVTEAGTYWVKAVDKLNQCENTASVFVDVKGVEIELPDDKSICAEETITLKGPSGVGLGYLWTASTPGVISDAIKNNQSISVNIKPGTSTTFTLSVTDDGCVVTDQVTYTAYPVPALNLQNNQNDVCVGNEIKTATTGLTYQWAYQATVNDPVLLIPGATNPTLKPTQSGIYFLTGTTAQGCNVVENLQVTVRELPVVTLSNEKLCYGTPFTFNGPDDMATYEWKIGIKVSNVTTQALTLNQPASKVTLTATSPYGCVGTGTGKLEWFDQHPDLGDRVICSNEDIILSTSSAYSNISWTFRLAGQSSATPISADAGNPHQVTISKPQKDNNEGTYFISAIDLNNCPVNQVINMVVEDIPPLDLGGDPVRLCYGESVKLLDTKNKFDEYRWENRNTGEFISDKEFIVVNGTGDYRLTVMSGIARTCYESAETSVIVEPRTTVSLSNGNVDACANEVLEIKPTVNVDAVAGVSIQSYQWLDDLNAPIPGENGLSLVLNAKEDGDFAIRVVDSNDCPDTAFVKVTRHPETIFSLPSVSVCDNVAVPLSVPGSLTLYTPGSYQWNYDGQLMQPNGDGDYVATQPGNYELTIWDANNCAASSVQMVGHKPSPVFSIGDDSQSLCDGATIEADVRGTNVGGFFWNGDMSPGQPSYYTVVGDNQTHTVTLLVTSSVNECTTQKSVQLQANGMPSVDLGQDRTVCAGEIITLTAPAGMSSVIWDTPEGRSYGSFVEAKSGRYILSVVDANNCKNSDEIIVNWLPLPQVDLGLDVLVCPIEQVVLDAGTDGASYSWEPGGESTQTIVPMRDTVIVVRVVGANGCVGWDHKVVYEKVAPEYSIPSDTMVCQNDSIEFNAYPQEIFEAFPTFTWSDGDEQQYKWLSSEGEYWVEVTDGCFILRDTTQVTFYPMPVIAQLDTMIYQQIAVLPSGGTEPYVYAINEDEFQKDNVFRDLPNGEYVLWVRDGNMCLDSATVSIFNSLDLKIPNLITPNGDGQNDTWTITGLEKFPDSNIRIYDRYGKLLRIYKPTEPGWDGYYLNKPMPSDDYWYVVELNPTSKIIKGHLTLKR
ncbi:MAG: T9SS type B sorting domain-containing protein [Marinilabiliaceae bacterium]|nr:T9SS type B sorting domain-containing protein [Marinilabiliaceae bacterium]